MTLHAVQTFDMWRSEKEMNNMKRLSHHEVAKNSSNSSIL